MYIIGYIAPSDLLNSNTLDFSLYSVITRASNILDSFAVSLYLVIHNLILYFILTPTVERKGTAIYV
tara:strand:+ start:122 stop:322 length:201 start_codon:yes stop_codon:yes gene_type:complete